MPKEDVETSPMLGIPLEELNLFMYPWSLLWPYYGGWRVGLVGKIACCSSRESKFDSQYPCLAAQNCLQLQLQGTDAFFWPPWSSSDKQCIFTQTCKFKNIKEKVILEKNPVLYICAP